MRTVPPSILAAGLALACSGAPPDDVGQHGRISLPNIVLVVVDTLRADLGGGRAGSPPTPHIDRLAATGVSFPRAFSHAPMTLPAHVALFSSRYPHVSGVVNNGRPVPDQLPLLAEHLRARGYHTRAVTSLGTLLPVRGPGLDLARGFDRFEDAGWGFISAGERVSELIERALDELATDAPFFLFAHYSDPHEPYNDHSAPADAASLALDGEPLAELSAANMSVWQRGLELPAGAHRIELSGRAPLRLRRLELEQDGRPLEVRFLAGRLKIPATEHAFEFVVPAEAGGPVHVSLWLTDHPRRREIPARYGSEVSYVDGQVGRLLDALSERGLDDETVLIFTSDHGESLGERRFIGHTKSLDDELIHVPLVMRLPPGLRDAGELARRSGDVVGHVDVVPTLLDLLGLPPLEGQQGRSLLGGTRWQPILSETHPPEAPRHLVALRDGRRKLVYDVGEDRFALYDLAADPLEQNDVLPGRAEAFVGWRAILRDAAARGREIAREAAPLTAAATKTLSALGYLK